MSAIVAGAAPDIWAVLVEAAGAPAARPAAEADLSVPPAPPTAIAEARRGPGHPTVPGCKASRHLALPAGTAVHTAKPSGRPGPTAASAVASMPCHPGFGVLSRSNVVGPAAVAGLGVFTRVLGSGA